jgi:hypothetical protein
MTLGVRCDDRATQGLLEELLTNRKSLIFNKILTIIHKSLFVEAAAKSDLARNGFVHTVEKTSTELAVYVHTGLHRLGARLSITCLSRRTYFHSTSEWGMITPRCALIQLRLLRTAQVH